MNIGILGTGSAGRALASKFASLGYSVFIGTRDTEQTLSRKINEDQTFKQWIESISNLTLGTFAEAAANGEVVISAVSGQATLNALTLAGSENLEDKILIDIASPLDVTSGFPPSLFVSNTDSLGEQIQRSYPKAKVVKTLNITTAQLMVNPSQYANGNHTIFVSGNDSEAKMHVIEILKKGLGWKDVLDLGDITTARGTEMLFALWIRIKSSIQEPIFVIKIVR